MLAAKMEKGPWGKDAGGLQDLRRQGVNAAEGAGPADTWAGARCRSSWGSECQDRHVTGWC